LRRILVNLLKIGISVAIVGYLLWRAQADNPKVFRELWDQPKEWDYLALACLLCGLATTTTFVRWGFLVRALGIPFSLKDSLRLGFVGNLFNLAPMGIAGGDLLRVVMLAWERPGNRAKALASVVVARLIGLYMVFVVASVAILLTSFGRIPVPQLQAVCKATHLVTLSGAAGIALLLLPTSAESRLGRAVSRLPKIGRQLKSLIEAVHMYRRKPLVLAGTALMSVAVHLLFAAGVCCVARGLFATVHSLGNHFVMMPLSAAVGVIPLPMGPFEWVLENLYRATPLPDGTLLPAGQGLVVALGYRVITLLIAAIGMCYYLAGRREVSEVLHEEEQEQTGEGSLGLPAPTDER